MALVCDICGGKLRIEEGGDAVCESCGMTHSSNRMKEKIQEIKGTVSIEGNVKTEKADFEILAGKLIGYHGADVDIVIPDGVVTIGAEVFKDMAAIRSVKIPDSVTEIGTEAFRGCRSLKNIKIPPNVEEISERTFAGSGIEDIDFPALSIKRIARGAFAGCSLPFFVVPTSITKIEDYVFSGCRIANISIPISVKEIGEGAFEWCESLTNIRIPNSVTKIGEGAFKGSKLLAVEIPGSVSELRKGTFERCKSLTSVKMSNGVTKIGEGAFKECKSLKDIELPNSVVELDRDAFLECTSLTKVTIPDSVTFGGLTSAIFKGCSSLIDVKMPKSAVQIPPEMFSGCTRLSNIVIPNGVGSIRKEAFKDCNSLSRITIPDSVEGIGEKAFVGCSNLVEVHLPKKFGSIKGLDIRTLPRIEQSVYYYGGIASPWFKEADRNTYDKKSGCYIATAIYGSYDCPAVWTLRRYRDETLAGTWFGRMFISAYYAISPTLVKWFGNTNWFKKVWRGPLDRMVARLNKLGIENTPYEDKKIMEGKKWR